MSETRHQPAAAWALGAALLAALLWLMRGTVTDMVAIWARHETYQHAFLVVPISLWLAWRKRAQLAATPLRPVPWMLGPIALVLLMWLLGELALVAAASQFALVGIIVLAVPALLGWALARVLAFPLLFLFFAVPFGEFMVPTMMDWTADFTIGALRLVGIPVYREGLYFVIPSGSWSVIEACSGARYLIASLMVGTLFAYLNFRSTRRRLAFIAVAALVPLVANWLRAFMIVMIGHLSDNRLAVGVDHLLYGWVFFGVVIGLMFFIGARWSDVGADSPEAAPPADARRPVAGASRALLAVAAGVLLLLLAAQGWKARALSVSTAAPVLPTAQAPAGWQAADAPLPWKPGFLTANTSRASAFREAPGEQPVVWEWVGYYRAQNDDRKLVSIANRDFDEADTAWRLVSRTSLQPPGGALPAVKAAEIQRGNVLSENRLRYRIWRLYWLDGRWVSDDREAKLLQAWMALRLRGDDGAVVLFATSSGDDADAVLQKFLSSRLGALGTELNTVSAAAP